MALDPFSYYKRLRRVRQFMEGHYHEKIVLARVARVASMESKALSRFFREKTGSTFSQWLADFRMRRACELLPSRNYSISEIAAQVGYHNVRSFQRRFKRFTGLAPREFRKQLADSAD